jgi:hypothetical protein
MTVAASEPRAPDRRFGGQSAYEIAAEALELARANAPRIDALEKANSPDPQGALALPAELVDMKEP